jgi:hypothetical protein
MNILRKGIRALGFDLIKVGNIEKEIRKREEQRELARIDMARQYRVLQEQAVTAPNRGKQIRACREALETEANKLLKPAHSVLDIGCAFRPQRYIDAKIHICCEPFGEYMDRLMLETQDQTKFIYMNCDLTEVCKVLPPKSIDTSFLIDVIEHVDKESGHRALKKLKQISRCQIVIFTPLGYMDQEPLEEGIDPWGMGGVEWQKHRSGWIPADFPPEEGWSIVQCDSFFNKDAYGNLLDQPIGAFWAIWNT